MITTTTPADSYSPVILTYRNETNQGELLLYGDVGFEITDKEFQEQLKALGDVETINLKINSMGGEVFPAFAIFNALLEHPARIVGTVTGIAASAASFILMAADEIRMSEASDLMIHRALAFTVGNAPQLRKLAGTLEKLDGQIAGIYSNRSGRSVDSFLGLMDKETWFTPQEAMEIGIVDKIVKSPEPKNKLTRKDFSATQRWEAAKRRWEAAGRKLELVELEQQIAKYCSPNHGKPSTRTDRKNKLAAMERETHLHRIFWDSIQI